MKKPLPTYRRQVNLGVFNNQDHCLFNNSKIIEKDVQDFASILKKQNEKIKEFENEAVQNAGDLLTDRVINTSKFVELYLPEVWRNLNNL